MLEQPSAVIYSTRLFGCGKGIFGSGNQLLFVVINCSVVSTQCVVVTIPSFFLCFRFFRSGSRLQRPAVALVRPPAGIRDVRHAAAPTAVVRAGGHHGRRGAPGRGAHHDACASCHRRRSCPVRSCQLRGAVHALPDGPRPAPGLPRDPPLNHDALPHAERERPPGEALALRYSEMRLLSCLVCNAAWCNVGSNAATHLEFALCLRAGTFVLS